MISTKSGKLLTVQETADYLGLTTNQVRYLEQKGDLRRVDLNSKKILFAEQTLKWFAAGIKTPTEAEVFKLTGENNRLKRENQELRKAIRDIYERIADIAEKDIMHSLIFCERSEKP